jgi:drug/metabolite transporter (DMT)-like permease
MLYLLALGAALANALTSVFQRMGVEQVPESSTLTIGQLSHALRRGIWLVGFVMMLASFTMQATALHLGRLSQVQPVLTTELLFLVLILATWFRFRVRAQEWLAVVATAGGLAGFLVFAQPSGGSLSPAGWEWAVTIGACLAAMTGAVLAARRGSGWWRAAMFGTAGGISFALTAALTEVMAGELALDWTSVFRHWQVYALALFGLMAVFLAQHAYHAGPVAASQSTLVLVDPLASILIGVGLFGDNLSIAGVRGPLEALSLAVMFAGTISLARSPIVRGMKGDGDRCHELLSNRSRNPGLTATDWLPPESAE